MTLDFRDSPEQARLRAEVRAFAATDPAVAARRFREDGWIAGFDPDFSRRLAERGWIGMTWPKRYGGRERSYLDRLIVTEELLLAGAPVAAHWFGDRQIGPALLHPLALVYGVSGSAMISATLRVPKP